MLFTKKSTLSVEEKQIKQEVKNQAGQTVLKINLRYPEIKCGKRDPLSVNAAPFYKRLAEGFLHYAKTELAGVAELACKSADFAPYSAVMSYEQCQCDGEYISFYVDIAVSDGVNPPITERKTQVWERKFGTKCRFCDFFRPADANSIFEGFDKRAIDRELFVKRGEEFEFFVRKESGFASKKKICEKICK